MVVVVPCFAVVVISSGSYVPCEEWMGSIMIAWDVHFIYLVNGISRVFSF